MHNIFPRVKFSFILNPELFHSAFTSLDLSSSAVFVSAEVTDHLRGLLLPLWLYRTERDRNKLADYFTAFYLYGDPTQDLSLIWDNFLYSLVVFVFLSSLCFKSVLCRDGEAASIFLTHEIRFFICYYWIWWNRCDNLNHLIKCAIWYLLEIKWTSFKTAVAWRRRLVTP